MTDLNPFDHQTIIGILACAALIHQRLYRLLDLQNLQIRICKQLVNQDRHRLNDTERRQFARLAKAVDRKLLEQAETLVTPDTFRRWHRTLIAATYTPKNRGRPSKDPKTETLVIRLATENPTWGQQTIADRAAELGVTVCSRTVAAILRRHGILPAPERRKLFDMDRFLEAHAPGLIALDCATWEVPHPKQRRTIRHHAFYAIRVATREVRLLGVTNHADGAWTTTCCRNLTAFDDDFCRDATAVLMDRDPIFTEPMMDCFRSIGCEVRRTPPHSPRCNAYIERFIGTTRREIRQKIIPLSGPFLEHCLRIHVEYYNRHRTHQSLPHHRMPDPAHDRFSKEDGDVVRHTLIGNTLSFYTREAA